MADAQKFSMEKYAAEWQRVQSTVAVEGVLHEDGEFYVIDPRPSSPGTLYRVNKCDVDGQPEKSRILKTSDGESHLHRVYVKKGVPIAQITLVLSDELGVRRPYENPYNDNPGLINQAYAWLKEGGPSTPPPGAYNEHGRNQVYGKKKDGTPWVYVDLRRRDNEDRWHANLIEVDLNAVYWNDDGYLTRA